MKDRVAKPVRFFWQRRRNQRALAIALLAVGAQAGCGREFYREWANSDVTEAIFEKSRDPRWRLDQFSIDPPALSRFADPYDPDRPPAPPDDFPTQSLSPVPQWPDHRLQMPVEGTGYLKLLDEGPRYTSPPPVVSRKPVDMKEILRGTPAGAAAAGAPEPPPGGTSPFTPGGSRPATPTTPLPGAATPDVPPMSQRNSGPNPAAMSPTSLAAHSASQPSSPSTTRPGSTPGSVAGKDDGIKRVAMQDPARTMPAQTIPINPLVPPPRSSTTTGDPLQTPKIPGDPNPTDDNLNAPENPRRDLSREENRAAEEKASDLAGLFVPENVRFDEATQAGLRTNSSPYILTMEKAFQLAIINSRTYQFQLENVYVNALPVTLQRFSFEPQFIAGLSPTTGAGGFGSPTLGALFPTQSPANSFLYNTRETGSQVSALNFGTVAGVGKLADNGTRVLASFANSLVFNFVGRNPAQPTVRSFLPIQALVPFLRGGGRAVTLEGLTQAERSLLYSIRLFAKFRQEFVVATLIGGTILTFGSNVTTGGFTTGGNVDPTIGYLNVVEDLQLVENNTKNVAVFERFSEVYKELINGEASGLSLLQLDQIRQQVQNARSQLIQSRFNYRNDLDQYKIQLGMPPDTPMVIDRTRTIRFKQIFEEIDQWSLSPRRELTDLDEIVARLPKLENIVVDGRSLQDVFSAGDDQDLESLLLIAERVALENRLDLMNARAQLYDSWRQIRVSANALKGYLNVSVTNQILTPPTTNNPFGFLDQAKSFSLVFNAELPLVRVAERNNFRLQLINYQRQRRTLQATEDFLKYQLRNEIRQLEVYYRQYIIAERNLVLTVRQKDQAFEQIIAPPVGNANNTNAATQTLNLIQAQSGVIGNENNLVTLWYNYQTQRLQVYRDLGILPFDEWEAFDELFPKDGSGRTANVLANDGGNIAPARPGGSGNERRDPPGLGRPIPVAPAAAANSGGR